MPTEKRGAELALDVTAREVRDEVHSPNDRVQGALIACLCGNAWTHLLPRAVAACFSIRLFDVPLREPS